MLAESHILFNSIYSPLSSFFPFRAISFDFIEVSALYLQYKISKWDQFCFLILIFTVLNGVPDSLLNRKTSKMKKPKIYKRKVIVIPVIILLLIFAGIQFIRPVITNPPVTGNVKVPHEVQTILRNSCYDCHSNETNLSWYDKIVPVSWFVPNI